MNSVTNTERERALSVGGQLFVVLCVVFSRCRRLTGVVPKYRKRSKIPKILSHNPKLGGSRDSRVGLTKSRQASGVGDEVNLVASARAAIVDVGD